MKTVLRPTIACVLPHLVAGAAKEVSKQSYSRIDFVSTKLPTATIRTLQTTTSPYLHNFPSDCPAKLDLAVVLDLSGSVMDEYATSVSMARHLAYGLDVSSDLVRMASICFADQVSSGFDLLTYRANKKNLLEAFDFALKAGGKTDILSALSYLRSNVFLQVCGCEL